MIKTAPGKLGEMTLSVLQGERGPLAAEFGRLVRHIRHVIVPDVVILTNSMLAPIATALASAGGGTEGERAIPTLSGFLGEDAFVMGLPEPYRAQCVELIRLHAKNLRTVLCPSRSAAEQAGILLDIKAQQIEVVPAPADVELYTRGIARPEGIMTVGYLSAIRPAKGLDVLIRAMQRVADTITAPIRVLAAGQVVDGKYLRSVQKLASRLPAHVQVEFLGEVSLEQKLALLHQCDVMCTPSRIAETRAMAAMEAMAFATPLVAPAIGCFPELLAEGGGWLFEPESVDDLARRLIAALSDPELRRTAGEQAASHVRAAHHPHSVAQQMDALLTRVRLHPRVGEAVSG
jgi:glycosyltransferase involved in cell wall biosynthesis